MAKTKELKKRSWGRRRRRIITSVLEKSRLFLSARVEEAAPHPDLTVGWGDVTTSQVKRSTYPPAAWIHSTAAAGMTVHVRTGGNFVASKAELSRPLLLVAGGIGIAPLYSILADAVDRCGDEKLTATLLYMARGASEQCV